jgi:hypothetical protein
MGASGVAAASAEHVRQGREHGCLQICHGKAALLRCAALRCAALHRIRAGDRDTHCSPRLAFRGRDELQTFAAIGRFIAGDPYPFDIGEAFRPFRRRQRPLGLPRAERLVIDAPTW